MPPRTTKAPVPKPDSMPPLLPPPLRVVICPHRHGYHVHPGTLVLDLRPGVRVRFINVSPQPVQLTIPPDVLVKVNGEPIATEALGPGKLDPFPFLDARLPEHPRPGKSSYEIRLSTAGLHALGGSDPEIIILP